MFMRLVQMRVNPDELSEFDGGGGTSAVCEAHDAKLDRPVVLEFLPPDLTRDPEVKEWFSYRPKSRPAEREGSFDEQENCIR